MSEDHRRDDWYRARGRLRGTLLGCLGIGLVVVAIVWCERRPTIFATILVVTGFAIGVAGWLVSAYDVLAAWRVTGEERRAWIAQHGDPDRRDDPAEPGPRRPF